MINGHTNGQYLDHPSLHPFWERAEALGGRLHSSDRSAFAVAGAGRHRRPCGAPPGNGALRPARMRCGWFSAACSIAFRGQARARPSGRDAAVPAVAFRQPRRALRRQACKKPSDYIKQNFVVTTSGMSSAEPLNCALAALGNDRVMFAADYPFEQAAEAGEFLDKDAACRSGARRHRVQECGA